MARQTSLYTFRNKLGNVRGIHFSNLPGEYVGLLGGPTAEQIANNPEFIRTRENMSEFGGSSHVARFYRVGVASLERFMESYFSGYLNTKVLDVCHLGTGNRGERSILFTLNQTIMEFTQLDRATPFGTIAQMPYTMNSNIARNQATLFVPQFVPQNLLNAPSGATHYQLICGATAMSDFTFVTGLGYQPVNAIANGISTVTLGTITSLTGLSPNQTVVAGMSPAPTMADATMFTTIGIQFYQQINAVFYLLAQSNVAQIDLLF